MKLVRYGAPGTERAGMLAADGSIRDLAEHVSEVLRGLAPASVVWASSYVLVSTTLTMPPSPEWRYPRNRWSS
jgi:hypothetical protein